MPPLVPDPALVEQLRASLKLTGSEPAVQILGGSPRAFERFLMAHGHSVAKAAKAMAATLRFRKEHELDSGDAPHAAIAKVAPLWPGGKVTNTKDGSPVYFFGYGHLDPRALMRNISEAEVTAFYLHFMDGMMHETNRVNPPQCSSHTWLRPVEVHDMQGLCFAVHVAPPALLLLARVIGYGQAHIPDNVRMAVFIHAPRWFSAIWGVLKCARPGPARRSGGVYFSVSGGAWAAGEPARFPHRLTSPLAPALSGKGHVHTEPGSSHRRSG